MDKFDLDHLYSRKMQLDILLAGCWPPYVDGWSPVASRAISNAVLFDLPLTEPLTTAVFNALSPDDGRAMVSLIEASLGLVPGVRFTEKPRTFLTPVDGSQKIIDSVAVAPDFQPDVPPIFSEFKFNGAVNGGRKYCPNHGLYGNQVICYPAGCFWTVNADKHYMVWIGLRKNVSHPNGPWGVKAINERDVSRQTLGPSTTQMFADQNNAQWDSSVALEDLCDAGRRGTLASQVFARLLGRTIANST